jgi:hypothetical protein
MLRHEGRKSLPRCCMGVDVVAQRQFAGKKRHAEMLRHASIQRVGSEVAVANQVIADADALAFAPAAAAPMWRGEMPRAARMARTGEDSA